MHEHAHSRKKGIRELGQQKIDQDKLLITRFKEDCTKFAMATDR
jgi:hypothetical protein